MQHEVKELQKQMLVCDIVPTFCRHWESCHVNSYNTVLKKEWMAWGGGVYSNSNGMRPGLLPISIHRKSQQRGNGTGTDSAANLGLLVVGMRASSQSQAALTRHCFSDPHFMETALRLPMPGCASTPPFLLVRCYNWVFLFILTVTDFSAYTLNLRRLCHIVQTTAMYLATVPVSPIMVA